VVATHLNHIIGMNAAELLGRQEVQQLLDLLAKDSPKLVEDFIPKVVPLGVFVQVLQNLLTEGVPIRDLRTIVETVCEIAPQVQDPDMITARVRLRLGRAIVQQLFPEGEELSVISLEPNLEKLLMQSVQMGNQASGIEPGLAQSISRQALEATQRQEQMGHSPVLIVPAAIRQTLARYLRRTSPNLRVLAHEELPETRTIRVNNLIGRTA